jgi:hypothetical protein
MIFRPRAKSVIKRGGSVQRREKGRDRRGLPEPEIGLGPRRRHLSPGRGGFAFRFRGDETDKEISSFRRPNVKDEFWRSGSVSSLLPTPAWRRESSHGIGVRGREIRRAGWWEFPFPRHGGYPLRKDRGKNVHPVCLTTYVADRLLEDRFRQAAGQNSILAFHRSP